MVSVPGPPRIIRVLRPGGPPLHVLVVDRLRIGRSGDGLVVGDPLLSRQHCELRLEGDHLIVEDLGSRYGTSCNGVPVEGATVVAAGDVLALGSTTLVVDPPLPGSTPAHPSLDLVPATPGSPADLGEGEVAALAASVVGGTLTIVFSDIVDSTALNARLGDREWFTILQRHNEVLRRALDAHGGREIKGQGDGFLLSFASARRGVDFAVAAQTALHQVRADDPDWPVHVRIGVHTGEVIHEGGDIFGWHVNLAARISAAAGSDEVVISSLVRDLLGPVGAVALDAPREVELKGLPGTRQVHPLRWRDAP